MFLKTMSRSKEFPEKKIVSGGVWGTLWCESPLKLLRCFSVSKEKTTWQTVVIRLGKYSS